MTPDGYAVLRDYTGHGIGRAMNGFPDVPNHGQPGRGRTLKSGMVLAIEPMVVVGDPEVVELDDGWTVVTVDGSRSVHWETPSPSPTTAPRSSPCRDRAASCAGAGRHFPSRIRDSGRDVRHDGAVSADRSSPAELRGSGSRVRAT